ncbi:MAG: hypothetical protein HQL40_12050, partial [Alphaproteobacteria bacterium]|nr:hypothetical protein [Alphaproteobacteria bacterium]
MPIRHYLELLAQYRRLVIAVTLGVGLVSAAFSLLLLLIGPQYRATAGVTVLPTHAELSFSERFQQGGSNPAGLMMQTHIEYLISRPVAELTLDKLVERGNAQNEGEAAAPAEPGWIARMVGGAMHQLRVAYHLINYGEHVDPSPYDEAVTDIQRSVAVRLVEGSFILQITASADNPEAAALIANTLAEAYVARIHQTVDEAAGKLTEHLKREIGRRQSQIDPQEVAALRNRLLDVELSRAAAIGQVRVIDPAQAPLYPAFPKLLPNTAAGLVAGAMVAVMVVIVLDTFGGTARTTADMRRLVGEQFLGGVPR